MRISDWSSDVCSSDLHRRDDNRGPHHHRGWRRHLRGVDGGAEGIDDRPWLGDAACAPAAHPDVVGRRLVEFLDGRRRAARDAGDDRADAERSEEHTSELQSLMRISYAVFCLKKKKTEKNKTQLQSLTHTSSATSFTILSRTRTHFYNDS